MTVRRFVLLCAVMLATAALAGCRGDDKQPVSTSNGVDTGDRMVLARDQRLLIRSGGKEEDLLRTPANTFPTFPVWSPDGSRIAYVQASVFLGQANQDWGGDIYVVNAGGGEPRLVWKHDQPGAQVQGLAWTPDGSGLLFGYLLTLVQDGRFQGQIQKLDRLDLATGQRTTIVEDGSLPSVSRDGTRMAYMKLNAFNQGGLWVSDLNGANAKQLVEIGARFLAILGPRISPDGSAVAFAAVSGQVSHIGPSRSQDGLLARIAGLFTDTASAHGAPMDVWRVEVADAQTTRLTTFAEDEPYPAWSADGRTITIFATGGLYRMNADGSDLQRIAEGTFGGQVDVA